MQEQKNETVLVSDRDRPTYEYSGGGVVKKNGVEVPIASLSEFERVSIGEEILRQTSERTGTPVSELRKLVSGYASGVTMAEQDGKLVVTDRKPIRDFAKMVTPDGKPVLVHQGRNRKVRRSEHTLKRRATKRKRT